MGRQQEISRIAYELYLQRGMAGDPFEDWVEAEKLYEKRQTSGSKRAESESGSSTKQRKRKSAIQTVQLKSKKRTRATLRRSSV
jgi:hypothetical protein